MPRQPLPLRRNHQDEVAAGRWVSRQNSAAVCPLPLKSANRSARSCGVQLTRCLDLIGESDRNIARISHERLLCSLLLITNYVADAIDPQKVGKVYWFLSEMHGVRALNAAGIYYIALNFCLLLMTFLAMACFVSVSFDGVALSRELLQENAVEKFEDFQQRLIRLTRAYYYATFMVFAYVINVLIWKASPLGATTANIYIAGSVLTIVGLFLIALPRRYVQHLWATYEAKKLAVAEKAPESTYRELLPPGANLKMDILCAVFLGSWYKEFWGGWIWMFSAW